MIAASNGNSDITSLLLQRGADVNNISNHRQSALYLAKEKGHKAVSQLLLSAGARQLEDRLPKGEIEVNDNE